MSLFWILTAVLASSGMMMGGLMLAYGGALRGRHIFAGEARRPTGLRFVGRVAANMIFSAVLVYALVYAAKDHLFHARAFAWPSAIAQAAAILALYDFAYYLMHRFAFHRWAWLKRVHAVHHVVRHPRAIDSLYLHPVEAFLGLLLLMVCTLVVGPVHVATFGIVFAIYSYLNIVIHCGMSLPVFPLRIVSALARKHDTHHTSMRGGNFASITPLWDLVFGTAE